MTTTSKDLKETATALCIAQGEHCAALVRVINANITFANELVEKIREFSGKSSDLYNGKIATMPVERASTAFNDLINVEHSIAGLVDSLRNKQAFITNTVAQLDAHIKLFGNAAMTNHVSPAQRNAATTRIEWIDSELSRFNSFLTVRMYDMFQSIEDYQDNVVTLQQEARKQWHLLAR